MHATSPALGTLEELPADYVRGLHERNLAPLWPSLRSFIPLNTPTRYIEPYLWPYADIRPLLLRAGQLTPIEKAERRVLVLCNPGYGIDELRATPTIYVGLQLILPAETAPNHRHTPAAIRFVIEGRGAYTVVAGEKLDMEPGDLILTPSGLWHEHRHDGSDPVIWLDALDLPLHVYLETSHAVESPSQKITDAVNAAQVRYQRGGVVPYAAVNRPRSAYPLMRFPWQDVRETLDAIASTAASGQPAHVAYVNPETGQECLPTLGFSALRLAPNQPTPLPRHSASMVCHVVAGRGSVYIDGTRLDFDEHDTFTVPTYAAVQLEATGNKPAYLFLVDDAPLQRKMGFYQVLEQKPALREAQPSL